MSPDTLDPAGLYFGTRSGKLYGSKDEGKSWKKIVEGLPQIVCVKAAVVQMDGAPTPRPSSNQNPEKRKTPQQKLQPQKAGDAGLIQYSGPPSRASQRISIVCIEVKTDANLLEALQDLFVVSPGLRDRVLTESGEIRRHVNIFLGIENVRYTGGLATVIYDGAEVSIVPAITGG